MIESKAYPCGPSCVELWSEHRVNSQKVKCDVGKQERLMGRNLHVDRQ